MSKIPKIYIWIAVAASVAVGSYYLYNLYKRKYDKEGYQIALGMLAPQNYFYAKCTNDCVRDKTGDSAPGQFLWLCTDKCAEIAKAREIQGVPDITREDYQRYMTESTAYTSHPETLSESDPYKNNMWNSEYLESDYCMNDIVNWCAERYCPFSNLRDCMKDCIKMKGVDCGGAVIGGWMH